MSGAAKKKFHFFPAVKSNWSDAVMVRQAHRFGDRDKQKQGQAQESAAMSQFRYLKTGPGDAPNNLTFE